MLDPSNWGPPLWKALHRRPLVYSDLTLERNWLNNFPTWIPCGDCRQRWYALMLEMPPYECLLSPLAYARWIWQVHNAARREIGQREMPWPDAVLANDWSSLT